MMRLNLRASTKPLPSPPPENGPQLRSARQALAEAIDRRNHLAQEIEADRKALAALEESAGDRRRAVLAAKAAVETAKANAPAYLVAQTKGTAGEPPLSVKDACALLQEAEDAFEIGRTAIESLSAKIADSNDSLRWARQRVKDRIADVFAAEPSFRKLFAEYEALREQMAERARLLSYLFSYTPKELQGWQSIEPWKDCILEPGPWHAVLAELENNPDAPLPT